ncbi:hypothetical protein TNCV_909661 [Trichonephila clavipes]|nr:hypothetical protein TNCV_909661 [Trichonephila clavipes]
MSCTRRAGSGRPRKTTTASSAAIQAQVAPSLGAPVSSQTIKRCVARTNDVPAMIRYLANWATVAALHFKNVCEFFPLYLHYFMNY